jgi:DegV family protein with EDD domain
MVGTMGLVRVVTDSTADLAPDIVRALNITVLPVRVRFGAQEMRDGVTVNDDAFLARLKAQPHVHPETVAPTVEEFEAAYSSLAKTSDSIISIHISGKLSSTCFNATEAKERYIVRDACRVTVIDSRLTSLGLGFVVQGAARAALEGRTLDEVARLARGMLPQTHVLFFVDTLEYLERGGRTSRFQSLLSSMINIKPLMRLDDGEIILMEKVRTRAKAMERLYEFVADFPHVEALGIAYSTTPNEAHNLARRLEHVAPSERVTITRYGPGLLTHLGPGALGVIVYEGIDH